MGIVFVGGGCTYNSQPLAANTSTPDIASTITPKIVPSSTPILIDKPISEWPRYEFKELGFSIQLPFKDLRARGGIQDCAKPESRCDNQNMHSYGLSLHDENSGVAVTVFAHSPNFSYDGAFTPFSSSSLIKITDKQYQLRNFKLLKSFSQGGRTISMYDGGEQFFYEWNEEVPRLITVLVPLKVNFFPAAAIIFYESNFSRDTVIQIIKTLRFIP